jgi:hypothetical protein
MNLGAWFRNCRKEYKDDASRRRLLELFDDAYQIREEDPGDALHRYREGKELANRLGEAWWSILFDKMQLDAKCHYQRDYRDVLEPAAGCVRAVRESIFDRFPARAAVHDTLVAAYLGIDAEGYHEAIQHELETLEHDVPVEASPDRYCLLARQRMFAEEEGRWEDAQSIGHRELDLGHADPHEEQANHFLAFTYPSLCRIAYELRQWDKVAEHAHEGEPVARAAGHQGELAELLSWRAVAERQRNDRDTATKTLRDAATKQHSVQLAPRPGYFRARVAYYEIGDQHSEMLHVYDEALAGISDRNRLLDECRLRIERLRVLIRLERSVEDDLELARHAARRLRFPEKYLAAIDGVEQGDAVSMVA